LSFAAVSRTEPMPSTLPSTGSAASVLRVGSGCFFAPDGESIGRFPGSTTNPCVSSFSKSFSQASFFNAPEALRHSRCSQIVRTSSDRLNRQQAATVSRIASSSSATIVLPQ
jgi:hypothetical protein